MAKYRVHAACVLFGVHGEILARGGEEIELSAEQYAAAIVSGQKHKLSAVKTVRNRSKAPSRKRRTRKKA